MIEDVEYGQKKKSFLYISFSKGIDIEIQEREVLLLNTQKKDSNYSTYLFHCFLGMSKVQYNS